MNFLITSREDMKQRRIEELDFILISGDAYVDHPSFAAALIGRFLEAKGFKVGIIAQPDWTKPDDFLSLGRPRLAFGVTSGNMDSMVAHYTADKRRRRYDEYSPGGKSGHRPDRAVIVYTNRLKELFPGVPVIIGGIEASLRRIAHYDYWENRVRRSILLDSRADLLIYGMGEYPLYEVLDKLAKGYSIKEITDVRQTAFVSSQMPVNPCRVLPTYEDVCQSKDAFNEAVLASFQEMNPVSGKALVQGHANRYVVVNPPALPLTARELDFIYEQPFTRQYHPSYREKGGVPALEPVKFSVTTHRGCFGGCYFCSLALHQGRFIQSRSITSVVREVERITNHPEFRGTIQDLGGPSANMFGMQGKDQERCARCKRTSCLYPSACPNLDINHDQVVELLQAVRRVRGVKHAFVASGVRYDLILADPSSGYLEELCRHHISGQLKVAPEHVSPRVTAAMGKPPIHVYERFRDQFFKINRRLGKKQYLIPYFIAAHPGCELKDMLELAEYVRDRLQYFPEQVQNFTPTPMTISTAMYYTGKNPFSGKDIYVPRDENERQKQRALLQYRDPKNRELVREALLDLGRSDLIGSGQGCLLKNKRTNSQRLRKKGSTGKEHEHR